MKPSTPAIVAVLVTAIGIGTLYLAATQGKSDVRFVEDVLADPAAHRFGTYTLMGIPQPEQIPVTTSNGTMTARNPDYSNTTTWTTSWSRDGALFYSTHKVTVENAAGALAWRHTNETRRLPADRELAFAPTEHRWSLGQASQAFPVEAFRDGARVRVWAYYAQSPENPIQPKPSQLTGQLIDTLPDGTRLPEGAAIFAVESFTAGCSSKFLPPELQDKYDDEGNEKAP